MHNIEEFMNNLTDKDWGWWPVLFLRPRKDQEFNNRVLLKLTLFAGPITGLILFLIFRVTEYWPAATVAWCLLYGCLAFFFGYKFTFAIFWNRRARRLRDAARH